LRLPLRGLFMRTRRKTALPVCGKGGTSADRQQISSQREFCRSGSVKPAYRPGLDPTLAGWRELRMTKKEGDAMRQETERVKTVKPTGMKGTSRAFNGAYSRKKKKKEDPRSLAFPRKDSSRKEAA